MPDIKWCSIDLIFHLAVQDCGNAVQLFCMDASGYPKPLALLKYLSSLELLPLL